MVSEDPQFARSVVLHYFDHIQVYLLLGAIITTLGLLSGAFLILKRQVDRLLLWFTLFALIYGLHLIMDYQLLWWLGLRPEAFRRIVIALEFLIPIPAFFFFNALDLLGRMGRILAIAVSSIAVFLALATLVVGPNFRIVNHVFVAIALLVFIIALLRTRSGSHGSALIRRGTAVFVACALYINITGLVGHYYYNIEPFGFVVLIACLGLFAGRRALAQEQQFGILQKELEIARNIQLSILPDKFPDSASFHVAARYFPMTSVAGDFYDFISVDDKHAGILIADVSGHGVPAALIASMVKLAVASQSIHAARPSELLNGMNVTLCGNTQSQFVTAAYVYLDVSAHEIRYAAAAHPAMLLLRDGTVSSISENGLMLAAFSFAEYTEITQPLRSGDRFLLYTDGILEAANADGEEFGQQRLTALLRDSADLSHSETADQIVYAVQKWAPVQNDDLTVLVCDLIA